MSDGRAAAVAVSNAVRGACEAVLRQYDRYVAAARSLDSPNPEDDEWVKLAIAGFSAHVSTELWSQEEFRLFSELDAVEFTEETLADMGPDGAVYHRFGCLCLGAVLGLRRLGAIQTGDELVIAHSQVMVFMAFNEPHICELERL